MKSASLRLGGIPKSYDEHLLVIGDAAGFIDPLTGGIWIMKCLTFYFRGHSICFRER